MSKADKIYNTRQENLNMLKGTSSKTRYRSIINELGLRNITLSDIADGLDEKLPGFLEMVKDNQMTLDELVVLQQYAKSIVNQDTRAAEFLRDTRGEKPSTQVDVNNITDGGLSQMSLEELKEFKKTLEYFKDKDVNLSE